MNMTQVPWHTNRQTHAPAHTHTQQLIERAFFHRCNKRFFTFLTFFSFFPRFFYLKKTLSNAKYKYVKIQRKMFLEDDLAMIFFIDLGLLRSLYCKISYLLAEEHWSHKTLGIWQPTYDSACKDNSWIHGKCRQCFYPTFTNVFFIFSTFLRFLTFLFSSQSLLHLWTWQLTESE